MKLDEFFRCVGGGYGEAKARFQNDERIVRFLNMFPGDDSMQNPVSYTHLRAHET